MIRAAQALASHEMFSSYHLQLAVMTPRAADVLAIPAKSAFLARLDLAMEIVFPMGQPLWRLRSRLHLALSPVLELAEKGRSSLALGYHRVFQESGEPRPVRYHYLMHRHASYSRADYLEYYAHSHSRFGLASPLADYYQTYLDQEGGRELATLFGVDAVAADNISELRFASVEDYLRSDIVRQIGPAASADEELFVNRKLCQSFSMDVLLDTRNYRL